jgi:multidrug efflux system outer membrane protein
MFRSLWGILCLLCITIPLFAAPGDVVLTLDDVVAQALEHSISLQKGRITLEDQEYSSQRLWALVFPTINPSASLTYSNRPFLIGTTTPEKSLSYSVSAGISLGLTAGIPYQMKILRLAYQRELLNYEDTRRLLEIAVAKNFYTLIAAKEGLTQYGETLTLAERQLEKNRTARANGFISEIVLLQSQLAVETAKYNLSIAQANYANNLGIFLTGLGMDPATPVALTGEFNIQKIEEDPERLIGEYLSQRPDVKKQRQEIERLDLTQKQRLLDARAPSLSLSFDWSGSGGIISAKPNPLSDSISGSVRVSIPVNSWIPGTTQAQALRTAKSGVETALLDLKNIEDNAAAQIRSLTASLRNSWNSLEIARLREQIAQRSYELTERGFLAGTVESLALEDSRNSLSTVRQELLERERDYQITILNLAQELNVDWRQFVRSTP